MPSTESQPVVVFCSLFPEKALCLLFTVRSFGFIFLPGKTFRLLPVGSFPPAPPWTTLTKLCGNSLAQSPTACSREELNDFQVRREKCPLILPKSHPARH